MACQLLDNLPSPPGVAVKLLELYGLPEFDVAELERIIGSDPALTVKIMRFANSANFARQHPASSLRQAITVLGAKGVKTTALSFSLVETKVENTSRNFSFENFWRSSLATAVCAKAIYGEIGLEEDSGFLLGLLMNIGQLAFVCSEPEKYDSMLADAGSVVDELALIDSEILAFGMSRYDLAVQVLEAMGFPPTVSELLGHLDHADHISVDFQALRLASRMSYLFLSGTPDCEVVRTFGSDLAKLIGEDKELYDLALKEYAELADILSYRGPSQNSLHEIEIEAKNAIIETTISLCIENSRVVTENDQLRGLAFFDALTGLGNRRQYESMLASELARCSRLKRSFALIVVDIDDFKRVNDKYGHAAGDSVLIDVAARLEHCLRGYDFLFRIGGEEFVVIQPEADIEACRLLAERLRDSIACEFFDVDGTMIPITISMGGTVISADTAVSNRQLFEFADRHLYQAKKSGRNRAVVETFDAASLTLLY